VSFTPAGFVFCSNFVYASGQRTKMYTDEELLGKFIWYNRNCIVTYVENADVGAEGENIQYITEPIIPVAMFKLYGGNNCKVRVFEYDKENPDAEPKFKSEPRIDRFYVPCVSDASFIFDVYGRGFMYISLLGFMFTCDKKRARLSDLMIDILQVSHIDPFAVINAYYAQSEPKTETAA
jgi:hypothetical protein